MTETELSRAIGVSLIRLGFWMVRSGVTVKRGSHGTQSLEPGFPDWMVMSFGLLEVKLPGKPLSEVQRLWHEKARRHGIKVETVESVQEAIETALRWRREREWERSMGWPEKSA